MNKSNPEIERRYGDKWARTVEARFQEAVGEAIRNHWNEGRVVFEQDGAEVVALTRDGKRIRSQPYHSSSEK
tara:strand:+ start:171 stop:386 length:216 start_codon:yes stop_codon:yes gene_type:complete